MSQVPTPTLTATPDSRAVLLWRPDSDESEVRPNVQQVAQRLGVEPAAVVAAITSGNLLEGWFVDWEVAEAR